MDASILKFSGRTEQLNELVKRWELASDLVNPKPQVVTIKAERGIGKTRLAWEFFKQLSKHSIIGVTIIGVRVKLITSK